MLSGWSTVAAELQRSARVTCHVLQMKYVRPICTQNTAPLLWITASFIATTRPGFLGHLDRRKHRGAGS